MEKTTGNSRAQIALHCLIAALIGVNYVVNEGMEDVFDANMEGTATSRLTATVYVWVAVWLWWGCA